MTRGMWSPERRACRPLRGSAFLGRVKISKNSRVSCHSGGVFVFTRILLVTVLSVWEVKSWFSGRR